MDKGEPVKTFLYTTYSPESYVVIKKLLESHCKLVGVLFAPSKIHRLGIRTRIKNFLSSGSLKDPGSLLRSHGVPFNFTDDHNGQEAVDMVTKAGTDVLLLFGTKIIKTHVLEAPKIGTLNTHSALLPKYRGGKSEFWILYNNEPEYAGVTIHWVTPGLDEGDIFLQQSITVDEDDTPHSLRQKSVPVTAELFADALERIARGEIVRIPQDETQATKYRWPTAEQREEFKKIYEERRKQ